MQRIDGMACCGIYYVPVGTYTPQPLPLLSITTEITLTPTYSRTVLKQHFKNPSPTEAISEANYVFPLHTTQTITSFTCRVGEDKTLNGIVQSKPKAKATYEAAISRGETAGLLSWAASDVWQTKLGNVPAGASIEVIITCVAQLQHDSEKDAIRFNLPTYIASRYGAPPQEVYSGADTYSYRVGKRGPGSWTILRGANNWVDIDGGMNIKVFVEMDSPIKMVEAPAHATNLTMGTHSTSDSSEDFDPKKALLTLSAETTALDKDFIVLVKTARSGYPSAVVQRHPTKDTASMMVTLVPKFNMPVARPEVVFICDRSGSMSGNEVQLRKALAVFLQSLPVGCKFNICSFGSSHNFLWSKSKTYSEQTLKEAQRHVAAFEANMGGTEMFPPVKAAIERRYKDINLELLLLTDGDIWQRDQLMDYVREQCKAKTVRMFTLGIGNGISHALIDGLASVGGGYSQVVQLEEKLDSKVVRMLRAALGQHVSDYTLELAGSVTTAPSDEDEYDMLGDAEPEKVVISGKKKEVLKPEAKKISLFDTTAELDPPPEYESKDTDEARWAHLPPLPKLPAKIQSPHVIPPLFSFSRTNAYVVFSPCPKTFPKVAKLQAKTISGDILELEIPVLKVADGEDVSQLAARSFLQELEDGKGYLHEGLLSAEGFTKDKQESKWDEIIEREGVRWGEGFGVASKWTSFVAIEDKLGKEVAEEEDECAKVTAEEAEGGERARFSRRKLSHTVHYQGGFPAVESTSELMDFDFDDFLQSSDQDPFDSASGSGSSFDGVTSMFGSSSGGYPMNPPPPPVGGFTAAHHQAARYRSAAPPPPPPPSSFLSVSRGFASAPPPPLPIHQAQASSSFMLPRLSGAAPPPPQSSAPYAQQNIALEDYQTQLMLLGQQNKKRLMMARSEGPSMMGSQPPPPLPPPGGLFPTHSAPAPPPMLPGFSGGPPPPPPPPPPHNSSGFTSGAPAPLVYEAEDLRLPSLDALQFDGDSIMTPPPPMVSSIAAPTPRLPLAAFGLSNQLPRDRDRFKFEAHDEEEELEAEIDTDLAQIGDTVSRLNLLARNVNQAVLEQNRKIARCDDKTAKLLAESGPCSTDGSEIIVSAKSSAATSFSHAAAPMRLMAPGVSGYMSASPKMAESVSATDDMDDEEEDQVMEFGITEDYRSSRVRAGSSVATTTSEQRIHGLIMLQSFSGSFSISDQLGSIIAASFKGASASDVLKKLKELAKTLGAKEEIIATWAAVLVFEKGEGHAAERDTWELVVEKAVMWVEGEGSGDDVKEKVRGVIGA
ncbi:uncharacterized protein DFL_003038 [Arthrobotrys flagrans]|uniref:VWFA domain-containing protein n=1 Tax=Arthrobotrys flagrans TaxID=97331 RepID=A0A437ADI1_ARTFL|nr:hypothetical protein DFL_003038 [Arthrobotrys flagrans]